MRYGMMLVFMLNWSGLSAAEPLASSGRVPFPAKHEDSVPEAFRLPQGQFTFELKPKWDLRASGVSVLALTFPSPITSPHVENNTVHAEYFLPKNLDERQPGVIVLDILDGQQVVSRGQALWLAQHNIPALVVYMAYYGPRRPPGTNLKLLTTDIRQSVSNIQQTVLDCRRAVAWLKTRPEIDPDRIGLLGTSLGSLIGGVVVGAEPDIHTAALLLGGGGLVDSFSNHPKAGMIPKALELIGLDRQALKKLIDPVDPLTYASQLKNKKLLLIAASRDDVVPPEAMKRLWQATDKPKIVWYDATHVGAALYLIPMMREVVKHIQEH